MRQADLFKKQLDEAEGTDAEADFQAVWTPVKAYLCKNLATSILNKLFLS